MGLLPHQIEINGVTLGWGTQYTLSTFETNGLADLRTNDRERFYGDGMDPGVDLRNGAVIPISVSVDTETFADASAALRALLRAWDSRGIREFPGQVVPLRVRPFPGAGTRVLFGRCRKLTTTNEHFMDRGRVDLEMEFVGQDHLWYDDKEEAVAVTVAPPLTGGWTAPFTVPLGVATTGSEVGAVFVKGDTETWFQGRVMGPFTNPRIVNVGRWETRLNLVLAAGRYVDIDARPWVRSINRDDGASLDGVIAPGFTPLSQMVLVPGVNELSLDAIDGTGTASMTVRWRGASTTPYW